MLRSNVCQPMINCYSLMWCPFIAAIAPREAFRIVPTCGQMSMVTWVDPCLVWCWTIENHDHPCQKSHSNRQWNLPWPKHNEPIRAIDQSELSVSNLPQQLSLPWVPHKNHLILRRLFQQLLTRILIESLISDKLTRHQYMAIYQQGSPDDMSPK